VMRRTSALFAVAFVLFGLYASPACALTGFVDESTFRAFDPFAVDVYVQFLNDILSQVQAGYLSYYTYNPAYFGQGSFPIRDARASGFTVPSQTFGYNELTAYTFNGNDLILGGSYELIGMDFDFSFDAMGFFLTDPVDHSAYFNGGEYITRATLDSTSAATVLQTGLRGINDVFIGYINDVTGFNGLWAGWYRGGGIALAQTTRSVDYFGVANSVYHFLSPAAYIGTGGDPHMISRSTSSEMSGVRAGDIVNLIDNAHVSVNAAIREFTFLPESMRDNNYMGTVAVQLAGGERVLVEAFETEEGVPAYSVSFNGQELAEGAVVDQEAFRVQYDRYERLDGAHGHSWFEEQFPFQQHGAIVRVWVYGEVVVDVSLTAKDHFVDWRHAQPVVHERAGAFLNVNMRDLKQNAETAGLLREVDGVHKRKLMRERAVEAGMQLEERDIDVDFEAVVRSVVDAHRVDSLF